MIEIYLQTPHPPAVVLAALRAHTGEWRESQIPPVLWRNGVAAIECRIAGSTCQFSYRRRWNRSVDSSQFLRAAANRRLSRTSDPYANYLVSRLETAVARAGDPT
jgi:hypothetical protein